MLRTVLLLVVVSVGACTKRNPNVCCETADECAEVGYDEPVPCELGVCVSRNCVETGCDGDEDCASPELCMQGTCRSPADRCAVAGGVVVFSSDRDGNFDLFTMVADGSALAPLISTSGADTSPVPSPSRAQIAYIQAGTSVRDVFVINSDGTNPANRTNNADSDESIVWSPNGEHLAVVANLDATAYVVSSTGVGGRTELRREAGARSSGPTWQPTSTVVMFASDIGTDSGLFTVKVDGSSLFEVHGLDSGRLSSPRWSPDGTKVAYLFTPTGGSSDLYLMNQDGSNARNITMSVASETDVAWSPDSATIAFVRESAGGSDIWTIDAAGTNVRNVTFDQGINARPRWSPDGNSLLFESTRDGNREVYRSLRDGTGQINLTSNPSTDQEPDWLPCPPP